MIDKIRDIVMKYFLFRKKSLDKILVHFGKVRTEVNDFIANANDDVRKLEKEVTNLKAEIETKNNEKARAVKVRDKIKDFLGE